MGGHLQNAVLTFRDLPVSTKEVEMLIQEGTHGASLQHKRAPCFILAGRGNENTPTMWKVPLVAMHLVKLEPWQNKMEA